MTNRTISIDFDVSTGPHGVSFFPTVSKLHDELVDLISDGDLRSTKPGTGHAALSVYTILAHTIVEDRSSGVLYRTLPSEDMQTNATRKFFRDELNQYQRTNLLFRCDVISNDVYDCLETARTVRNSIAHELYEDESLSFDENVKTTIEKIHKGTRALEDMYVEEILSEV
jgi:hypothetical protein